MHHKYRRRYKNAEVVLKKCAKLIKQYPEQRSINETIKQFLENEDYVDQKKLKSEQGYFKRRLAISVAAAGLLLLLLIGAFGFWKGLHYKYFYPDQYGAFKIEALMRETPRYGDETYLMCSLFYKQEGKWEQLKKIRLSFKKEKIDSEDSIELFRSRKTYLRKGEYLVRLDMENEQCQRQFFLPSTSIQNQQPRWRDGYLIRVGMEENPPLLPLKLNYAVRNILGNQDITEESQLLIFYRNRWVTWERFSKETQAKEWFTSGKEYSFKLAAPGFFTRKINVSVGSDQTVLRLDVTMTPKPGRLFIQSKPAGMIGLLNNMPDYLEGGTEPKYKKLGVLRETGQQISLPGGDYFLTVKEDKPWWRRFSIFPPEIIPLRSNTQKISIKSGETLWVTAEFDQSNETLNLIIK
jgi:hypothetical protein